MTDFRRALNDLRRGHRSARYPGDLASELLPRRPILPRALLVGTAAAVVIGLATVALLNRPAEQPGVVSTDLPEEPALTISVPEPDWSGLAPPEQTMAPSYVPLAFPTMPAFPSYDGTDSGNPTSQEAV